VIRRLKPDKAMARSMISAARDQMEVLDSLQLTSKAGPIIVREIYEQFRMLGDALLTAKGVSKGIDQHKSMIQALMGINTEASRSLLVLDTLRILRHKINYEGYVPTPDQVRNVVDIKKTFWKTLLKKVEEEVKN